MFDRDLRKLLLRTTAGICYAGEEGGEPAGGGDPPPAEAPAEAVEEAPAETVTADPAEAPEPVADEKPKKDAVAQLQGRIGYLTKKHAAELAELRARLPTETSEPAAPVETTNLTSAQIQEQIRNLATAEAKQIAAAQSFNEKADALYEKGKEEFSDFEGKMTLLRDLGVIGPANVTVAEAAMATGDGHKVLYALGQDTEEAARIAGLPPVQMGVELAKLAAKLNAKPKAEISRAPAPISPLGGIAKSEPDLYDPDLYKGDTVGDDYIALRAKSGAAWYAKHRAAH